MPDPISKGPKPLAPLVLVADDVASLRLLYSTLLIAEGYRVVEVRDGLEALERIRGDRPALAILDVSMPRMDGIQVLEALRRAGDRTPVLVITAHKEREVVLAAAQKGIVSYLTKPINIADFRDRVRRTLLEHGALKAGSVAASPDVALDATLDPESRQWLASAPREGWNLARLDEFLQAGEDLGAIVASIALAADAAVPHEPSRAERVAQLPLPTALAKLQAAFERGDAPVKAAVVELLPASAPESHRIQLLSGWLQDPNPLVRTKVVSALVAIGSPAAMQALLPAAGDPHEELRRKALGLMEAFGWLKLLEPLLERQAASGAELPEELCERLRALPAAHLLDRLRGILREGGSEIRAAAARLAPRLGIPEARRLGESALGDPEGIVRAAALEGLARAGDRRAVGLLLELVTDPDPGVQESLRRSAAALSLRPETQRILQRAAQLGVEARTVLPGLLSRLEAGGTDLVHLLVADLRSGEGNRLPLLRLAEALGFRETLPPGALGPVMATACAEHLAELLLKPVGGGGG